MDTETQGEKIFTRYSTFWSLRHPRRPYVLWPLRPTWNRIASIVLPLLDYEPMAHLPVLHCNQRCDMFFGEEAEAQGLFKNAEATSIFRAALLRRYRTRDPESFPTIFGPAVVFHRQVWDGDRPH